DSVVVASTAADQVPSAEETEPFETDEFAATPPPHPAYHPETDGQSERTIQTLEDMLRACAID
nr:putative reverse transcriptase domain-containing protein [Tanacetum cinerariifolium]